MTGRPIFYLVTTRDCAVKIARDWNVKASGSGCVTRFEVRADVLAGCAPQLAEGRAHEEYRIPAEEMDA